MWLPFGKEVNEEFINTSQFIFSISSNLFPFKILRNVPVSRPAELRSALLFPLVYEAGKCLNNSEPVKHVMLIYAGVSPQHTFNVSQEKSAAGWLPVSCPARSSLHPTLNYSSQLT